MFVFCNEDCKQNSATQKFIKSNRAGGQTGTERVVPEN